MAERDATGTITTGPMAGSQFNMSFGGNNPFQQQSQQQGMVPYQPPGGLVAVVLPSGARIEVSPQQAQILQQEAQIMRQQQQNVVDLRGGGGGAASGDGLLTTGVEAGQAITEWLTGRDAKRMVKKAKAEAAICKDAERRMDTAIKAGDMNEYWAQQTRWFEANRALNAYQNDICLEMSRQAYIRAGGGVAKVYDRIKGGMGGGGLLDGDRGTSFVMGLGSGFLFSNLLDDDDDDE